MTGFFALVGVFIGSAMTVALYELTRLPRRGARRDRTTFTPCPWCPEPMNCQGHYR